MKEKQVKDGPSKEYFKRMKLKIKSTLNGRNKKTAMNTWEVSMMRYGAGIIGWNKNRTFLTDEPMHRKQ